MKKTTNHGSFKTEAKAQARIKLFEKSDKTRDYYIYKRVITTSSGGHKTKFQIRADKKAK